MVDRNERLIAHLMRRAGFGASRKELETRAATGYEETVEELVDPVAHGLPGIHEGILFRHYQGHQNPGNPLNMSSNWIYRMIKTPRPLEEKTVLLWHQIFATGYSKIDNANHMLHQIDMFRKYGMGSYRELLIQLAKNPAMIFWLDNNENHKGAPNENWGRELLELFSMGQGHYSEEDVKECSRAFTGWTIARQLPKSPYGRFPWEFEYNSEDHDNGEKVFLGHRGNLDGEDIIEIILKQPATVRFIARHLYNFFVEDEVQVPSWLDIPPRNPEAVRAIAETFQDANFDVRSTLRFIFNSDFFKDEKIWFKKVKSPAELIVGTMKLVGDYQEPRPGISALAEECIFQGQSLLDPPSVEGWHTGQEWLNTGSLLQRINFVSNQVADTNLPGIQWIISELARKETMSGEELVKECLDLMGLVQMDKETLRELVDHASKGDPIAWSEEGLGGAAFASRVTETMQLISSTREYQFA